jgi:hypothetical protein
MKFKIILASLIATAIFAEQEKPKSVVDEHIEFFMHQRESAPETPLDLIQALEFYVKLGNHIAITMETRAKLLAGFHGDTQEFKDLCTLFDVMHKECEGVVTVKTEPTTFADALQDLKESVGTWVDALQSLNDGMSTPGLNNMKSFIRLYKQAYTIYATHMNNLSFRTLYHLMKEVNKQEQLPVDRKQTDERIKKFKRMAIGAMVSGFVEGGLNAFHAGQ